MQKKITPKKKSLKKKPAAPAKRLIKKKLPPKKAPPPNRRIHRRIEPKDLWITEKNGDLQFRSRVANISSGGVFILGRVFNKTKPESELCIGKLTLRAQMVYDRKSTAGYGVGYQFDPMNSDQKRALGALLRDLN